MVGPCPAPCLQLESEVVIEDIPDVRAPCFCLSGMFANGRLFISDLEKVIWLDPETRQRGVLNDSANMTIRNKTPAGEPILRKGSESYWKITLDSRQLVPLVDLNFDELPQVLGFTSSGDEIRYLHSSKRIERVDSSRRVVESVKLSRTTGVMETMTVADDGLYYSNVTAVLFWPFGQGEKEPLVVAGSHFVPGAEDGIGRRARFRCLRHLMLSSDSRHIYLADFTNNGLRYVRINTSTDEVRTLSRKNIASSTRVPNFVCPANDESFFVLDYVSLSSLQGGRCQLRRAHVVKKAGTQGLSTWQTLDLTALVQPLSFHLFDGTVLHFDSRILKARSDYFRKMLESGCREAAEGRVDLTSDTSIGPTSLGVVLRFIATGAFLGPNDVEMTTEKLFDIRSLADRYQLTELMEMVESHILENLSETNVLTCLQNVLGTGHKLEIACWDFVETKREEILEQSKDSLAHLIRESPELGVALLTRNLKRRRT